MVLCGHFRSVVRELIKHIQFETVTSFSTDFFKLDQTHLCLVYFILLEYFHIYYFILNLDRSILVIYWKRPLKTKCRCFENEVKTLSIKTLQTLTFNVELVSLG